MRLQPHRGDDRIGIVAILATLAVPSYLDKIIRDQVVEALPLGRRGEEPDRGRVGRARKPFRPTTQRPACPPPTSSSTTS